MLTKDTWDTMGHPTLWASPHSLYMNDNAIELFINLLHDV